MKTSDRDWPQEPVSKKLSRRRLWLADKHLKVTRKRKKTDTDEVFKNALRGLLVPSARAEARKEAEKLRRAEANAITEQAEEAKAKV